MVHERRYASMHRSLCGLSLFVFLISVVSPRLPKLVNLPIRLTFRKHLLTRTRLLLTSTTLIRTARLSIHPQKVNPEIFLRVLPLNAVMVPTVLVATTLALVPTMAVWVNGCGRWNKKLLIGIVMNTVLRATIFVFIILFLGACSNLQEVRDFTSESARLSSYTGIIDYTFGGYTRSEPYLLPDIRATEKAADATRQASRESLIGLQKLSVAYMTTLAKLAGADTFNIDANIDKLATSIKESPNLGVQSVTVDAYANLVHKVSKWVLTGVQEKAVRDMIKDGGGDFEKIISGMGDVVRILRKVHDNESKTVINSLEAMIMTTKATPENYLILALAEDRLNEKRAYYAKGDSLYIAAAKGIKDIEDGHHIMAENLNRLDAKEVRDKLKQLRDDIKNVHDTLTMTGM